MGQNPAAEVSRRNPTLDGWRGIAILMVLVNHMAVWSRFKYQEWANLGNLGVDIFFVVSGYIITLQLLREEATSFTIDLGSFYLRRAFRILPLVCAYLSVLVLVSEFVNLRDFRSAEIFGSLFFFRNYQDAADPGGVFTRHFWSLSIEEHFYLIWPGLLLWLGRRRALWFAMGGAAVCGVWRFIDSTHPHNWIGRMLPGGDVWLRQTRTDARFDGLLIGCVVALLLEKGSVRSVIFRSFPKETPLFAALLLALNYQRTNGWATSSNYVLIACMLASTLVVQEGLVHTWLNSRALVWVGTISYSAYVWQALFLTRPDASPSPLGRLGTAPLNLICVLVVSVVSFYCIECPCIAHGRRYLTRRRERIVGVARARRLAPVSPLSS
jgi:peptidoglycan/LPS O-acetylase OafA/YrhL